MKYTTFESHKYINLLEAIRSGEFTEGINSLLSLAQADWDSFMMHQPNPYYTEFEPSSPLFKQALSYDYKSWDAPDSMGVLKNTINGLVRKYGSEVEAACGQTLLEFILPLVFYDVNCDEVKSRITIASISTRTEAYIEQHLYPIIETLDLVLKNEVYPTKEDLIEILKPASDLVITLGQNIWCPISYFISRAFLAGGWSIAENELAVQGLTTSPYVFEDVLPWALMAFCVSYLGEEWGAEVKKEVETFIEGGASSPEVEEAIQEFLKLWWEYCRLRLVL